MRLRTYLLLSYLALIAIFLVGAWFIDALRAWATSPKAPSTSPTRPSAT